MLVKDNNLNNIADVIERSMAANKVMGSGISVIKNGQVIHTSVYGVADPEENRPVTEDTHYEFASLTKTVFGKAVYNLALKGIIDMDKPLTSYTMEDLPTNDPAFMKVTAKDVMCHATGLPDWGDAPLELLFETGTSFGYSGKAYTFLQTVTEEITGKRIDIFLQDEIFNPLGMEDASMVWTGPLNRTLSRTFDADGVIEPKRASAQRSVATEPNVAFTLCETIKGYPKFILHIMDAPDYISWVRSHINPAAGNVDWGLGWGLTDDFLWHWGDNDGFKSFVIFDPDTKDGILICTNSFNGLSVCYDAVEHLTGRDMSDIREMIANAE